MNNLMSNNDHKATVEFPKAISQACKLIAPAWPLDTAIAVNPWWSLRDLKFSDVAAKVEALGSIKCLMSKEYYREQWQGSIEKEHLVEAAKALNYSGDTDSLIDFLDSGEDSLPRWHNLSDLLDKLPEQTKKMPWRDEIIQQISQFCGLYFQYPDNIKQLKSNDAGLYAAWLEVARQDKGIEVLMGKKGLQQQFAKLPECPRALCEKVIGAFGAPQNFEQYAHALLLDIHGWASWLAYTVWQDNFMDKKNTLVEQLLAIRLSWEWVLWAHMQEHQPDTFADLKPKFLQQFEQLANMEEQHHTHQKPFWIWQKAMEICYQADLNQKLSASPSKKKAQTPLLQAAFCIDVRSEPIRRALEAQSPDIDTLGFAGFFGLPIDYTFNNSHYKRPQLPGLLKASIQVKQEGDGSESGSKNLRFSQGNQEAFDTAPASFGLVEMLGLLKTGSLIKNSFWPSAPKHSINHLCDDRKFILSRACQPLPLDELVELSAGILSGMGLTKNFAPIVLLLGHGSSTANNPQSAGLDCGACGGQTGEVNVKLLAQLLNDLELRNALIQKGITIPTATQFFAGLHNTTTDEITCYGDTIPESHQQWLSAATKKAQVTRAVTLDIIDQSDVAKSYQQRSKDWSEVRPEWGLANNAAFIVAPRSLTRNIDLEGRAFMHNYDWQSDEGFAVLELIMTAPMIVTNWINLQYYASVTDNRVYGSGNKLLHNIVGEHIGVFEGNGGDLRIGLSKQSLHDGKQWRHQPLRLSVYIDAPRFAIEKIIKKHKVIAQLVNNDWLTIFQIDSQVNKNAIAKYYQSNWNKIA